MSNIKLRGDDGSLIDFEDLMNNDVEVELSVDHVYQLAGVHPMPGETVSMKIAPNITLHVTGRE